jgi:uncharacterized repeat protein (TIGR03803 family)
MKACIKGFLLLPLMSGLAFILASRVKAQTFTTLHSFSATTDNSSPRIINSDGAHPTAGVVQLGNTLYGTAALGGSLGDGTLFKVNTDGTGFTNLHTFSVQLTNGSFPYGGLLSSSGTLYGATSLGGSVGGKSGFGAVYAISTDGTGFTVLYSFTPIQAPPYDTNADGAGPYDYGGLAVSGNSLYGTTVEGGATGHGTVFKVNKDGTDFKTLYTFTAGPGSSGAVTNTDGAYPLAGLALSGGTLYGTTRTGGISGAGTVFAVNTDGTGFTNLHSFTGIDGASPSWEVVLLGNTLYGTTDEGGNSNYGAVFALNTDGTGFTNLHSFTGIDGVGPVGRLVSSGNSLYGTTGGGGKSRHGTVFTVNTDGTGFTNLYTFIGATPGAGLTLSGTILYGTTDTGGSSDNGTVFGLSFTPQLATTRVAGNVILTWPTSYFGFDYSGYTLQSATNLFSPSWNTNLPTPVVVDGLNIITNPISGSPQFFRLSQ